MARYIDADALKKCSYVIAYKDEWHMTQYGEFVELADIENTPTADVRENVHAHWVAINDVRHPYRCSNCGSEFNVDTMMLRPLWNFCPYCGAVMDERREE